MPSTPQVGGLLSDLLPAVRSQMRKRALQKAIQLRRVVRKALDVDDMKAVCEWNRRADAAYAALDPFDAIAYMQWALKPTRKRVSGAK